MSQPVHIRIAEAADARQIMAVINSAFKVAEDFFCFEDRITLEEVERLFTTGTFLVAEARAPPRDGGDAPVCTSQRQVLVAPPAREKQQQTRMREVAAVPLD